MMVLAGGVRRSQRDLILALDNAKENIEAAFRDLHESALMSSRGRCSGRLPKGVSISRDQHISSRLVLIVEILCVDRSKPSVRFDPNRRILLPREVEDHEAVRLTIIGSQRREMADLLLSQGNPEAVYEERVTGLCQVGSCISPEGFQTAVRRVANRCDHLLNCEKCAPLVERDALLQDDRIASVLSLSTLSCVNLL